MGAEHSTSAIARWVSSCALACALCAPAAVHGQVLYGSIIGNVTDDTGAAVPGAAITITNTRTQAARETVADESGVYRFTTIQPGPYKVVVALSGFGTSSSEVEVTPNNVTRVDVALKVGDLTETVTVRIYSLARTVAECFRFRNKIGLDVALEALTDAWRSKRLKLDELTQIARKLRIQRVMQPYLDTIVM